MECVFEPIGYLKCDENHRFEAPRQGVLAENSGKIELSAGCNFEHALEDLEGFDRIWLIYSFHLNTTWKPKVTPPRSGSKKKISVFATRSPHRPNSIGMSCVMLEKVEGRTLYIKNFDLLNNTPILDIKPYIPYCDSFPDAQTGWLPTDSQPTHYCHFSDMFTKQANFIYAAYDLNLVQFSELQLSNNPLSGERKRLYVIDSDAGIYELGCRTWRILFEIQDDRIELKNIRSSYSPQELEPETEDKYGDKEVHRAFVAEFKNSSSQNGHTK